MARPKVKTVAFKSAHAGQKEVCQHWQDTKCLFILGQAGTGKTHVALALAMLDIIRGKSKRIYLARPSVDIEESLGYVKGDLTEKLGAWMGPFQDVLDEMSGTRLEDWQDSIELIPVGRLGGRTIRDGTLIVDEAQNCTFRQLKCILTRIGKTGRVVLSGDYEQSELRDCPLRRVALLVEPLTACRTVTFDATMNLRDPFVSEVLKVLV